MTACENVPYQAAIARNPQREEMQLLTIIRSRVFFSSSLLYFCS